MSALISLFGQLVGLFVDDGWLALATLCIVARAILTQCDFGATKDAISGS
jgi:hypothetical protein